MISKFNNIVSVPTGYCSQPFRSFSSATETILATVTLNPGDIKSGQTFTVTSQSILTGTTQYRVKLYINSASTLTNATQLAQITDIGTNNRISFSRTIRPYGSTSLDLISTTIDDASNTSAIDYFASVFGVTLNTINLPYNIENITSYILLSAQRLSVGTNQLINYYLNVEI